MEHRAKRARTVASALEALWRTYIALVDMKEDARHKVVRHAAVHAALTHPVWDSVDGACQLVAHLEKRHAAILKRAQALTVAELRLSPPSGVNAVAHVYRNARAALVDANTQIADLVAGVPMRQAYTGFEDSLEALLAEYQRMDRFAHDSTALDFYADMHSSLYRGGTMNGELDTRLTDARIALDMDLQLGGEVCIQSWKLKAILRHKLRKLRGVIDRCSSGIVELEHVLGLAPDSDYAVLRVLPAHQCYVCLEFHADGLTWCSTCAGALCAGCAQELACNLLASGNVAASKGEDTVHIHAARSTSLACGHSDCVETCITTILLYEVTCQVCKAGAHSLTLLRRRLDDDVFEELLGVRGCAQIAAAVGGAMHVA